MKKGVIGEETENVTFVIEMVVGIAQEYAKGKLEKTDLKKKRDEVIKARKAQIDETRKLEKKRFKEEAKTKKESGMEKQNSASGPKSILMKRKLPNGSQTTSKRVKAEEAVSNLFDMSLLPPTWSP